MKLFRGDIGRVAGFDPSWDGTEFKVLQNADEDGRVQSVITYVPPSTNHGRSAGNVHSFHPRNCELVLPKVGDIVEVTSDGSSGKYFGLQYEVTNNVQSRGGIVNGNVTNTITTLKLGVLVGFYYKNVKLVTKNTPAKIVSKRKIKIFAERGWGPWPDSI